MYVIYKYGEKIVLVWVCEKVIVNIKKYFVSIIKVVVVGIFIVMGMDVGMFYNGFEDELVYEM